MLARQTPGTHLNSLEPVLRSWRNMCLLINPVLHRQRQVSSRSSLASSLTLTSLLWPQRKTLSSEHNVYHFWVSTSELSSGLNTQTQPPTRKCTKISVVAFKFPLKLCMYLLTLWSEGWQLWLRDGMKRVSSRGIWCPLEYSYRRNCTNGEGRDVAKALMMR